MYARGAAGWRVYQREYCVAAKEVQSESACEAAATKSLRRAASAEGWAANEGTADK